MRVTVSLSSLILTASIMEQPLLSESFWASPSLSITPSFFLHRQYRGRIHPSPVKEHRKERHRGSTQEWHKLLSCAARWLQQPAAEGMDPEDLAIKALDILEKLLSAKEIETGTSTEYIPALEFAVGAAKAFGAIDRNVRRSLAELGKLGTSLRRMAEKQSQIIDKYQEMAQVYKGDWEEIIEEQAESVDELMTLEHRLQQAQQDIRSIHTYLQEAQAANNEFIVHLSSNVGAALTTFQKHAKSTSQAFDEIDDSLAKAMDDVQFIKSSIKQWIIQ